MKTMVNIFCLWLLMSASAASAQSKDKFDATSVKLVQMENGITNILGRIIKLENQMGKTAPCVITQISTLISITLNYF